MIKRTPQEIADFFGSYVFQESDRDSFYMTKGKPVWNGADFVLNCDGMLSLIDKSVVDIPADHDWTHLYEPQNMTPESQIINEESDENCQKSGLCPHSGEVYTHKEYIVVHDSFLSELAAKVARHMENGWKLQGGVAIRHPENREDSHTFYQAMVRGV